MTPAPPTPPVAKPVLERTPTRPKSGHKPKRKPRRKPKPASVADISIVYPVHNRDGDRLYNSLASLCIHQTTKPREVIVVDTSDNTTYAKRVREVASIFTRVRLIRVDVDDFHATWAYNVGIRRTISNVTFVGTTDMDFMFSENFIVVLMDRLHDKRSFVMACAGFMTKAMSDNAALIEDWETLSARCLHGGPHYDYNTPGAIQAATRAWWFKVHGYDETFGLGNEDNDVWSRAKKSGLKIRWIRFNEAQAIHQWHPRSSYRVRGRRPLGESIVKNPKGWGQL